jgi:HSP20 family protein
MDLVKFDPFKEISSLRRDLSRLFGGNGTPLATLEAWTPSVDIYEDDKAVTIRADIPGVKKEDIGIEIEGDTLTIHGERKLEKEEKKENYQRIERSYGSFTRSVYLPEYIDRQKIAAEYKDGTLNLTLPKTEAAKPKQQKVPIK